MVKELVIVSIGWSKKVTRKILYSYVSNFHFSDMFSFLFPQNYNHVHVCVWVSVNEWWWPEENENEG